MPVAVMGMHRSGTSMVARLLNLCGVYLGEEHDMVPAHESNLAGHWEHTRMVELNDHVLEALGGTWQEPPLAPAGWERLPEVRALRERASELVSAQFATTQAKAEAKAEAKASAPQGTLAGAADWGWKDPRTSLTVPFWRAVVPQTRYIICVRNPLDVAASLASRDHMSARKALALWHWYTDAALRATQDGERQIVFYERFFPDVRPALTPILAFLGLPATRKGSEREATLRRFADPDLTHYSHTLEDVLASAAVPSETRDLYRDLVRQAAPDGTLTTFALPADPATRLHLTVAVEARQERAEQEHHLMSYVRKLEAAMRSYRAAQERTERERDEALAHLRDVEHALGLVRAAHERSLADSQEATKYARQLESALEHTREDGTRTDAERSEAVRYVRQLERALELTQADHQRLDTERAEAVAYARDLERALAAYSERPDHRDAQDAQEAQINAEA